MLRAPDAGRSHVDLARVGLGIGDELGNRLRRNRWIHVHDEGDTGNARHDPPSHHSITSSTVARSCAGTSRPSALAVCMLMMNSNLVDCVTGRSVGFAPLRILPV